MVQVGGYKTKQRDLILGYLVSRKGVHITVDDVVEHFKKTGNSVGKSTVYRYLDLLVKSGAVRKYIVEEGASACYQYFDNSGDCHAHYHLKCSGCGELIHVECEYLDQVNSHVFEHHGFTIDNSKTVLYGLCAKCAGKQSEEKHEK